MATKYMESDELVDLVSGATAATLTSDVLDLAEHSIVSTHCFIATGSPAGSWSIQGSNVNDTARFQQITSAATSAGDLLDDRVLGVRFIRVVYTHTSGSGTVSVVVSAKRGK